MTVDRVAARDVDHRNLDVRPPAVQRRAVAQFQVRYFNANYFVSLHTTSDLSKINLVPAVGIAPIRDFVFADDFDLLDVLAQPLADVAAEILAETSSVKIPFSVTVTTATRDALSPSYAAGTLSAPEAWTRLATNPSTPFE